MASFTIPPEILQKYNTTMAHDMCRLIPGWLTYAELDALKNVCDHFDLLSPQYVLEIGSLFGKSAALWASMLSANVYSRVVCVDIWDNTIEDFPEESIAGLHGDKTLIQKELSISDQFIFNTSIFKNIVPVRLSSRDFIWSFSEKPSIIFIDGDHSAEGLMYDMKHCNDSTFGATDQTLLVFHDYDNPGLSHITGMLLGFAEATNRRLYNPPGTMLAILAKDEADFHAWW